MKFPILYIIGVLLFIFIISFITFENEGRLGNNYYYLSEFNTMDYGYPEKGGVVYKSMHKNSFEEIKEIFIFGQQRDKGYFIINTKNDSVYKNLSQKEYENRRLKIQKNIK